MRRAPDPELIVLARGGSEEAAGVLFDRYWSYAWRAAYALTADRGLADDAAQEAMERAFRVLATFDETRPFGPWLKRIAVNRAIDHLRRRKRSEPLLDDAIAYHRTAGLAADDALRPVTEAVASLGAAQRVVVVLHYWLDLPLDEISGVLGIPVGTVASRLARGRERVKRALEEQRVL